MCMLDREQPLQIVDQDLMEECPSFGSNWMKSVHVMVPRDVYKDAGKAGRFDNESSAHIGRLHRVS